MAAHITPYARQVTGWLLAQAGAVGALTLQVLLTVVIAGMMYAHGESAAEVVRRFGSTGSAAKTRWYWPARRSAA